MIKTALLYAICEMLKFTNVFHIVNSVHISVNYASVRYVKFTNVQKKKCSLFYEHFPTLLPKKRIGLQVYRLSLLRNLYSP